MMEKLEPCPFCGEESADIRTIRSGDESRIAVRCWHCGAIGPEHGDVKDPRIDVVQKWNLGVRRDSGEVLISPRVAIEISDRAWCSSNCSFFDEKSNYQNEVVTCSGFCGLFFMELQKSDYGYLRCRDCLEQK